MIVAHPVVYAQRSVQPNLLKWSITAPNGSKRIVCSACAAFTIVRKKPSISSIPQEKQDIKSRYRLGIHCLLISPYIPFIGKYERFTQEEKGIIPANLGLPLFPSHPPTRRPKPKYPASLHTTSFPPINGVKKRDIPMCMACTAFQHHDLRPDVMIIRAHPELAVHYVGPSLLSDKS